MSLDRQTRKHLQRKKHLTRKISSGSNPLPLSLNHKISPGYDFYKYVNQGWLQKTSIPPTKSVFGVSEEIEKRLEVKMNELVQECIDLAATKKEHPTYLESVQQTLGALAKSVKDADKQQTSFTTFHSILSGIQSLQSKEEVAVILGEFCKYKIRSIRCQPIS